MKHHTPYHRLMRKMFLMEGCLFCLFLICMMVTKIFLKWNPVLSQVYLAISFFVLVLDIFIAVLDIRMHRDYQEQQSNEPYIHGKG